MIEFEQIVRDFAVGLGRADARRPIAVNQRSGDPFRPGIGPHNEAATIDLVGRELEALRPADYAGRWHTGVPYPNTPRQRCDLCIGQPDRWEWAIEVKMLRFLGDNGKVNDSILMHILSPYPAHRSALTDCAKLGASGLAPQLAVIIYGFEQAEWPLEPAIHAFEALAGSDRALGPRVKALTEGLVHPVHTNAHVYGWEIL